MMNEFGTPMGDMEMSMHSNPAKAMMQEQLATAGMESNIVGALIGAAVGLYGASKASSAAKKQAQKQNEATQRQYEYDLEMYDLNQEKILADRAHAAEGIEIQARNERTRADWQDASNARQYQYNLQIRNREQESLNQQFLKSDLLYHDQINLNRLAERTAQDNEYRKLEDIQAEAAFDREEANIQQLINEGKFRARGVSGKSADKASQVTYAEIGMALSRINESENNAGMQAMAVLDEISQARVSADLAAFAQKMLPPGIIPQPLQPLATPVAEFQMPREIQPFDWGPKPVLGAMASPSAAAGQVWGSAIGGIASSVMSSSAFKVGQW